MHRRVFLWGCALPGIANGQKPKRPQPYPEQQHPQSKRGRVLADFARSLRIRRGVPYASRPEAELTLDIYAPGERPPLPRPCILVFVLAAFKKNVADFRLDLDNLPPSPTPNLYPPILAQDRVLVVARVRVSSQAMFPAQIHDAKCALRWIGKNAVDLRVDPERIGLFGPSASGNLVSLLALTAGGPLDDPSCPPEVSVRVHNRCTFCRPPSRSPGRGPIPADPTRRRRRPSEKRNWESARGSEHRRHSGAWDPYHNNDCGGAVGLAMIERDRFGFLSLRDTGDGLLTTAAIANTRPKASLSINADGLGPDARLAVELIDKSGTPIRGYSGPAAAFVERSGLRERVAWAGNGSMSFPNPQFRVRLRFKGTGAPRVKFDAAYIA